MPMGIRLFRGGLARAARYRQVVLAAVALSLLSAMLATTPAALTLLGPAHRPAIDDVLDGVDAWMVIEAVSTPFEGVEADVTGQVVEQVVLPALATFATLMALTWLSGALVSGGALLTYAGVDAFRWGRFLRGCWRWFGTLLLLSALQALASFLVFGPLLALALMVVPSVGAWLRWVLGPLLLGLALFWLAWMELARVAAVVDGRRNVVRAMGRGFRLVVRRAGSVVVLYVLSVLSWLVLLILFRWALMTRLPRAWWVVGFALQQAFVALWLWIRLGRWAGGVALCRAQPVRRALRSETE
jgi:hypothetical protein